MSDTKIDWTETESVYEENSFGVTREEEKVELFFHVTVRAPNEDGSQRGFFEWGSNDGRWYAEGGLWFEDNELVDYDGVFSLAKEIIQKLHEQGFNVESMARVCTPSLAQELYGGEED